MDHEAKGPWDGTNGPGHQKTNGLGDLLRIICMILFLLLYPVLAFVDPGLALVFLVLPHRATWCGRLSAEATLISMHGKFAGECWKRMPASILRQVPYLQSWRYLHQLPGKKSADCRPKCLHEKSKSRYSARLRPPHSVRHGVHLERASCNIPPAPLNASWFSHTPNDTYV